MTKIYIDNGGNDTHFSKGSEENNFLDLDQMMAVDRFMKKMKRLFFENAPKGQRMYANDFNSLCHYKGHIYDYMGGFKQGRNYRFEHWVCAFSSIYVALDKRLQAILHDEYWALLEETMNPKRETPMPLEFL